MTFLEAAWFLQLRTSGPKDEGFYCFLSVTNTLQFDKTVSSAGLMNNNVMT